MYVFVCFGVNLRKKEIEIERGEERKTDRKCKGLLVIHLMLVQVFEAEKMTGKYGYYHKKCFKCLKCKRPLDYQTLSEGTKWWM